jgi:hypothetical protein
MRKKIITDAAIKRHNYLNTLAQEVYDKLLEQLSQGQVKHQDGGNEIKVQVHVRSLEDIPYLNATLADAGYPPHNVRQKFGYCSPTAIVTYRFTDDEIAKIMRGDHQES